MIASKQSMLESHKSRTSDQLRAELLGSLYIEPSAARLMPEQLGLSEHSNESSSQRSEYEIPLKMLMSYDSKLTGEFSLNKSITASGVQDGHPEIPSVIPITHDQIKERLARIPVLQRINPIVRRYLL